MFCSSCGNELHASNVFCPTCGRRVDEPRTAAEEDSGKKEQEAIESYFLSGYDYDTILCFLAKYHGLDISMSTLKRRLNEYGLKRRNALEVDDNHIVEVIQQELDGPSMCQGYRSMWHTLRLKYGLCVPRAKVQMVLKELDPDGTEERRRHRLKRRAYKSSGPNECWHVDGYDKLKPFGFPIHGAIDGYSRRVLWLKVTRTNNNPAVIANYYLECVKELEGCPRLLRTDPGTENGMMATIQCCLRANDDDELSGEKAHRYGSSTSNQRIECWWSHLKKSRTCWWINFFKNLRDEGVFLDGNTYQAECLWFCFNNVIQQDLDFVKLHWNTHYIRPSRHDTIPGKPDELFFLPECSGGEDQLQPVSEIQVEDILSHDDVIDMINPTATVDNDHQEYFRYVCDLQSLLGPKDWHEGLALFRYLITLAE